jgi:hypothetical protein
MIIDAVFVWTQVGLFGDLAPRRPKLRTVGFDSTARSQLTAVASSSAVHHTPPEKRDSSSVSREAILSDMRLIAGKHSMQCEQCQLNDAISTVPQVICAHL